MKKIRVFLLIIFTCFMATSSVKAQIGAFLNSVDEIGFSAGPSLVSLTNGNIDANTREMKIAYTLRLELVFELSERFSLGSNFMFERKGLKRSFTTNYYNPEIDSLSCMCTTSQGIANTNSDFDYFTFSLLVRYRPFENRFYIGLGGFVSYLNKATLSRESSWNIAKEYTDILYLYKNVDAGIYASIGYLIKLTKTNSLNIQIHDTLGLLDILKDSVSSKKNRTNSFSLQIGINHKF